MLKERLENTEEIIDDLELGGEAVFQNLKEIEKINTYLGGYTALKNGVRDVLKNRVEKEKEVKVTDIGCGGGDTLRALSKWNNQGYRLNLEGMDANPHMITFSKENSKNSPEIEYKVEDCFSDQFFQNDYDIITGNLFFHHFDNEAIIDFVKRIIPQTKYAIVITDLHRSAIAYALFQIIAFVFGFSHITKHDGSISIKRGFKSKDWEQILNKAGVKDFSIKWKWAFRHQIIIYSK